MTTELGRWACYAEHPDNRVALFWVLATSADEARAAAQGHDLVVHRGFTVFAVEPAQLPTDTGQGR